uniref:LRAT domain-containing protein n=1 Tax=Hucho hucho TaxID=62062 RepID=A0A4W5KDB5_9TELE
MMMRMKLTILAILLFQLTTSVKGFTFGDIIKFDRKKIGDIASYNHYATYVGTDKQIPGKTDKQDIFHFSGEKKDKKNANCVFAEMSNVKEESTPEVQNYRDHNATKRTNEDMTTTIISLHNNCTNAYNIISANCEHLATYIRYGSASCRQVSLFL